MKKLLLFSLLTIFQWCNSQIIFQNYVYSFGPNPYTATVSGSGTINYTTDGTEPTINSPSGLNNVDISISKVLTVKAILKSSNNQISTVFSKKYYFGPFPLKTVYFKKPPSWADACSFTNSVDPQLTLDIYSGPPMKSVCEGWYKTDTGFFVGFVTFDNCIFPQIPPVYQFFDITTEDTVYYDYSTGPITNPPACLLAVNDPTKNILLVKIFPNPVQDFIIIETENKFSSYEIVDFTGKSIIKNQLSGNKINVSSLASGIYFVKLNAIGNINTILKFLKK